MTYFRASKGYPVVVVILAIVAMIALAGCGRNAHERIGVLIPVEKNSHCPDGYECVYDFPPHIARSSAGLKCFNTPKTKCKLKDFYWGDPATHMEQYGDHDVYLIDAENHAVYETWGKP